MTLEKLTNCEKLVMKVIWETEEEIGLTDIMDILTGKYHKDWKPQTVSTFLSRLIRKGYVSNYRKGRIFLYHILISKEQYLAQAAEEFLVFWCNDNADDFLNALLTRRPFRPDEIERIKSILSKNRMDNTEETDYDP